MGKLWLQHNKRHNCSHFLKIFPLVLWPSTVNLCVYTGWVILTMYMQGFQKLCKIQKRLDRKCFRQIRFKVNDFCDVLLSLLGFEIICKNWIVTFIVNLWTFLFVTFCENFGQNKYISHFSIHVSVILNHNLSTDTLLYIWINRITVKTFFTEVLLSDDF